MDYQFAKFLFNHPEFFKEEKHYESYHYHYTLLVELWENRATDVFQDSYYKNFDVISNHFNTIGLGGSDTFSLTFYRLRVLISNVFKMVEKNDSLENKLAYSTHCLELDEFVTRAKLESLLFTLAHVSLKNLKDSEKAIKTHKLLSMFNVQHI